MQYKHQFVSFRINIFSKYVFKIYSAVFHICVIIVHFRMGYYKSIDYGQTTDTNRLKIVVYTIRKVSLPNPCGNVSINTSKQWHRPAPGNTFQRAHHHLPVLSYSFTHIGHLLQYTVFRLINVTSINTQVVATMTYCNTL